MPMSSGFNHVATVTADLASEVRADFAALRPDADGRTIAHLDSAATAPKRTRRAGRRAPG